MYFLYKTKTLTNKHGDKTISVELYDHVLGRIIRFKFDDELYLDITQQMHHILKDIKQNYQLKQVV